LIVAKIFFFPGQFTPPTELKHTLSLRVKRPTKCCPF